MTSRDPKAYQHIQRAMVQRNKEPDPNDVCESTHRTFDYFPLGELVKKGLSDKVFDPDNPPVWAELETAMAAPKSALQIFNQDVKCAFCERISKLVFDGDSGRILMAVDCTMGCEGRDAMERLIRQMVCAISEIANWAYDQIENWKKTNIKQ